MKNLKKLSFSGLKNNINIKIQFYPHYTRHPFLPVTPRRLTYKNTYTPPGRLDVLKYLPQPLDDFERKSVSHVV